MTYAQMENVACGMYTYTQINTVCWDAFSHNYHLYLTGHSSFFAYSSRMNIKIFENVYLRTVKIYFDDTIYSH